MSEFKFNEETGLWGYEDEVDSPSAPVAAPPAAPVDRNYLRTPQEQRRQAVQAETESSSPTALDDRPLFAETPGQFVGDLWKSVANPATALLTDYVDLGHGLVDIAGQTGSLISGNGFDGSKVFDDSDNPLTKARIDGFRSETKAGQFVNTTARVVVALATLPKLALKGLAMPLKLIRKAPVVGGLAGKGAQGILAADKALKATRTGTKATTTALNAIQKGAPTSKVAKLANADDWLKLTYKDVVNAGV